MGELFAGWRFALRRFGANWTLMLLVGVGALLATTLLAAAPIYTDTMSDIGLRFRLDRTLDEPRYRVAYVRAEDLRLGDPVQLAQTEAMATLSEARVGWLGPELLVEQRSSQLRLTFSGGSEGRPWPAHLVYLSGYEDHVTVVQGRLPSPEAATAEVVLPDGFQSEAAVGDRVLLAAPPYNDCAFIPPSDDDAVAADEVLCEPSTFVRASLDAEIVGFVRPDDPDDLRWEFFGDGWTVPANPPRQGFSATPGEGPMPLLTSGEYFNSRLPAQFPELTSSYRTGIVPDLEGLAVRDVPRALDDLDAWPREIRDGLGVPVAPRLEFADALATFRNAQTFSQVPLLLLLLQVAGVVAFYIVVLAALARERQAQEIAVYRSRGASTSQLLGLTLTEGLLLALPAALIGPFLAARAVAALGYTPAFEEITDGSALPASVSADAFLLAGAGALLALAAMLLPALGVVRRAIVDEKREQARPQRRGWFQRYYLDVGLVGLAALLVWQLDRRGSVFDPDSVGGWEADPLLLLSPIVLTAAAAGVILRLYPPLLRLLARLLRPLRGTSVTLGVGRAGRDPAATARLMLLVSTAIAVGTFAASYAPTVDRSFEERARYASGVDLHAGISGYELPENDEALGALREVNGVDGAVRVHRGSIGVPRGGSMRLLAIEDRDLAASMLWFRDDFADEAPSELLGRLDLGVPIEGGLALPDDIVALELLTFAELTPRVGRLTASIRDGYGAYHDVIFEALDSGSWLTISAELPPDLAPPLSLASIRFEDSRILVEADGALYLDDLSAVRAGGERVLVDDFEGSFAWTMYSQPGTSETFGASTEQARSGEHSARWTWTRETNLRSRVLAVNSPVVPINAVLSEDASAILGATPGDRATVFFSGGFQVDLIVRGTAELFPTLDPAGGFAIVDLDQLRALAGILGAADELAPGELWLDFEDGVPLADQQELAALLQDRDRSPFPTGEPRLLGERLEEIAADPTLQASGSGILLLAFAGAMGAALLGFVVSLAMTLRGRVVEVAVLRSLGSSRREILRALTLEWGVVLLLGSAVGVLLGRTIAGLMLQFLEVTETGAPVVPAFRIATEWGLLGAGIGLLVVIAAVTLWGSWRVVLRRADASALRLTQ